MDKLTQIHKEALKRFYRIENRERKQRQLAIEDMRFVNAEDGQWTEEAIERRADRPRYTINRVAGAVDQAIGDQRQNRTRIKVNPVSDGADEQKANIFNGLIRNIEQQSSAENIYDSAYDEELCGGYGGWRIINEYIEDSFDQELYLKPIRSAATSLYFDDAAEQYDKRDARFAFLINDLSIDEYRAKYPDAPEADFTQDLFTSAVNQSWYRDGLIRVAEYWIKTPCIKTLALLNDGRRIYLEDEKDVLDELSALGIQIVKERKVKSYKVEMYKLNGLNVMEGPKKWAGKYIPLIPVYGKITNIEGAVHVRGLTRFAKDPQRIYNYSTSAAIEAAALTPKDPYWLTPKQASGHETQLKTFNKKNQPFMLFNPDAENPGPPTRTGAPSVQQALLSQVQQAALDIESTTGLYAASMGNAPQLLSERSVQSQAEKGDRGLFVFQDNLTKSIKYTGEILIDLIPKIYDSERIVRVLNIDGTSENVVINQAAINAFNQPLIDQQTGKQVIVNDLTVGKYDVFAESGPAFNTLRQESAQQLIDLATNSPIFEQLATDLIAKNLNILENDELTRRVRRLMIQQGIVEPTPDEIKEMGLDQPQEPDPNQIALLENVQAQTDNLMAQTENKDADTQKKLVEAQQLTIKNLVTLLEAYEKQAQLGIGFGEQERETLITQKDIVQDGQDITRQGEPNSEQLEDLANQMMSPANDEIINQPVMQQE